MSVLSTPLAFRFNRVVLEKEAPTRSASLLFWLFRGGPRCITTANAYASDRSGKLYICRPREDARLASLFSGGSRTNRRKNARGGAREDARFFFLN